MVVPHSPLWPVCWLACRYVVFRLFLDKGFEGGKALLYERLLSFLNGKPLMANVDKVRQADPRPTLTAPVTDYSLPSSR